jgi:fructose-bisphosphate aldolase class I
VIRQNVPLGRILGIPIGLDYSWFLIFALLTWILVSIYYPSEFKNWLLNKGVTKWNKQTRSSEWKIAISGMPILRAQVILALARFAALCQEAGLVPVVEPEVLMDGGHTLARCSEVTEEVLQAVFNQLYMQRVMLEGMILKPNMVLPGLTCPEQEKVSEVGVGEQQYQVRLIDRRQEDVSEVDKAADATVKCLLRAVPAAVPGIAFLSGGQPAELASIRLNAMNVRFKSRLPWALAFSFARAIQQPALEIWLGEEANVPAAQKALYYRAGCNRAARRGEYNATMEEM